MKEIFNRRSVRQYSNRPIEAEKMDKIIRAAMQAPSAGNQQPWEFIVVQERKLLEQLSLLSLYAGPIKGAAAAIVLLGNEEHMRFPENWQMDLSAAAENILLEAVHLELGAVWLGVAPIKDRVEYVAKFFDLPKNIWPFGVIAMGYPETENKFVDRYDKSKVHFNRF